jgi:hypothetical protein
VACSRDCREAHRLTEHGSHATETHYERSLRTQRLNNRENPQNWRDFENHRARTMQLVQGLSPADAICVLGAGNCDDLDLSLLQARFGTVHLVDWDGAALERASSRTIQQGRIVLHPGVELTGLLEKVDSWGDDPEAFARFSEDAPARIARAIGGPFDVVLSSALLSQLSVPFYAILARTAPEWALLMHAVARVHLESMALLTRPGGHCVLIGDALYAPTRPDPSSPAPELAWESLDPEVEARLREGMPLRNPEFLLRMLAEPPLADLFERPTLTNPWRWTLETSTMLAYGIVLRRTGTAVEAAARPTSSSLDPTLVDIHTRNNRETAGHWELYTEHRRHVSALIESQGAGEELCILGAGNANGLDLPSFAAKFARVHLADLDAAALARAAERQAPATREKLVLHGPHDLSGLLAALPSWKTAAPSSEELGRVAESTRMRVSEALPGPFEVVVSHCMLTQIYWTCFKALGNGPTLRNVIPTALGAHLATILGLCRPGGSAVLVTDAVSSDGIPLEELLAESDPLGLLHELDQRGALFTGTSPALLTKMLREGELASSVGSLRIAPPWLWRVTRQRLVLVYALVVERSR